MNRRRQTIAIDIDDVLSANAEGFVQFSNERWGTSLTIDDYDEHWAQVWKTDEAETERRAIELHQSGIVGRYRHHPEAEPVLRQLAEKFELVVVTSRRRMLMPETDAWLKQHFAGLFVAVHYAGMWDKLEKDRHLITKAQLCGEIGADYLIDDQLKHCLAAAEAGIPAVLFGNYAWNRSNSLPQNVTRCCTWDEVGARFAALVSGSLPHDIR